MELKKSITINLSANDVKEIIADYLNKDGYMVAVDDISFSAGSRLEGYGMTEHYVSYFGGASVKCKDR